jgi:hypothetical protein
VNVELEARVRNVIAAGLALLVLLPATASAQALPKARVGELIRAVEDGVDEFRDYLEKRGDNARDNADNADRQRGGSRNNNARKDTAKRTKDALDEALDDLNKSTNRLRRKFDVTDAWMQTKSLVESVVDDGRKINQQVTRGNYGSQVARLWGTLRTRINELARAYNVQPLAP